MKLKDEFIFGGNRNEYFIGIGKIIQKGGVNTENI